MKIKEIIVVEGKNDTLKIKQAVEADTIETNGSVISEEVLELIRHAKEKRGVIIFTDPDYPGQRIRSIINEAVPGCKHAFLPKEEALHPDDSKNVGIEHASIEAIQEAMKNIYEPREDSVRTSDIQQSDLIRYGLIGKSGAKERRAKLGKMLHIGYANGRQLLKRLESFQITKSELDEAMRHILERGQS